MPRFRYIGTGIATNVAGETWSPGDVKTVLDDFGAILRAYPQAWLELPERDGGIINLGNSAVQVACASTATDESLYSLLIPAGTLGPNDELQIEPYWQFTNSANNKIVFVKTALGVDLWRRTRTTVSEEAPMVLMANRNALNSQTYVYARPSAGSPGHFTAGGQAAQTTTIDFSLDQTIIVGGQRANSGDSLTLERVRILLVPGA